LEPAKSPKHAGRQIKNSEWQFAPTIETAHWIRNIPNELVKKFDEIGQRSSFVVNKMSCAREFLGVLPRPDSHKNLSNVKGQYIPISHSEYRDIRTWRR
jgi:hypothetical protein